MMRGALRSRWPGLVLTGALLSSLTVGQAGAQGPGWNASAAVGATWSPRAWNDSPVETASWELEPLRAEIAVEAARVSRRRWPVFIAGAVVGGAGAAYGVREWCFTTATKASDCTPYVVVGGVLGAIAGGFIAEAIADIVEGGN